MTDSPMTETFLVGTYTRNTGSDGIYRVNGSTVTLAASCDNPSYLAGHPSGEVIYAVNEVSDFEAGNTGAVTAFFKQSSGNLSVMNQQSSMGADPCHISVSKLGTFLVVTNYSGGTFITLPLDDDGHLEQFISLTQHTGSSSHPERQQSAHIHSSLISGDESSVVVADLGADQLVSYTISPDGQIGTEQRKSLAVSSGAGPRLMASFGNKIYLVNELANRVTVHDASDLSVIDQHSTLPKGHDHESIASHIEISSDGKHLYVSNRGFDSIAVFSIEPKLNLVQIIPTGGGHPRHFTLSRDGLSLFVANQYANESRGFSRDPDSGALADTSFRIEVPAPTCLLLV
jgi:6-phosphogluconolactonase